MRLLAALLLALLLASEARADSLTVQTCGTLPLAYRPGAVVNGTVDVNGNTCISGSITASATTVVSAIAALPTLVPGNQTPTASLAGAAYAQPVFGSASGGGTQVDLTHGLPVNLVASGVTQPISGSVSVSNFPGTQPVSGTVAATQSGTWTVQPGNTANTTAWKVDGSAVTQPVSGTVTANQGGTWTVQPGNTANTTAWKVDGSAVTQPVSGTVTSNQGTANATPWNENVAQIAGSVPAMKASGTNAATTDIALVVAPSPNPSTVCTSSVAINQTASTDLVTSTNKLHICSILIVSATAQNLSLVEGTGSVCGTGTAALIGGTTASVAVAANGGWSQAASRPFKVTKTTADHLCLLQSGAGNVSGSIDYVDHN